MNNNSKYIGVVYACVTALLWGFLAIALKAALQFTDAITVVWFRFTLAFVVLFTVVRLKSPHQLGLMKKPPIMLLLAGLFLGANYIGYMMGIKNMGSNTSQIVIQTGPIMLAISGIVFFKEKVNWRQIVGFSIAALGLYFFYQNKLEEFVHSANILKAGFYWVFFAAVTWTVYAVFQKILVRSYSPSSLNLVIYLIPALLFAPFADFSSLSGLSIGQWGLMAFLGLNTLVAYGSIALAFKYTQAYKVSVIVTMNPIITLVTMSVLALLEVTWVEAELMSLKALWGAVLVLAGAIVAIYFSRK